MKGCEAADLVVREYLPQNSVHVDLLQPELMTPSDLLALFERRGLGCLVSKSDPFHRLVDLYYDHLMPMPMRPASPDLTTVPSVQHIKPVALEPHTVTPKSTMKRKAEEVQLDSLVIKHNPNWTTPGETVRSDERVLSVKKPKSFDTVGLNHVNHSVTAQTCPTATKTATNGSNCIRVNSSPGTDSCKKRVKLKRDFTGLS
ncbi:hypothetical protein CSKR_109716 [Clonorchis sinensis]|uniref:Uncharacterized protein n=2 Tax=Clonorchis sinensis TaxID=79923 RepID=A0A8T1LRY2_CLOSI|nr:hypothetical protein CSKR_109716 [Clonorchis sinensis]GAA37272.1 hypothetical protein CLF_110692 [Clonorchis sinensis]